MPDSIEYDLIIAGSGLAGLRAAIEAAKKSSKIKIGVIAKTQVMRSHSVSVGEALQQLFKRMMVILLNLIFMIQ